MSFANKKVSGIHKDWSNGLLAVAQLSQVYLREQCSAYLRSS